MAFAIPEMKRVKERFPQYKDIEDVTLMNTIARKFPVYKPLALEVGERIRAARKRVAEDADTGSFRQGKPTTMTPERKLALRDEATLRFADRILEASRDAPMEEIVKDTERFNAIMTRAPRVALALTAPLFAIGIETLQQGRNALVTSVKKEKYDPIEFRLISELLPKETPTALKFATNLTEALAEVALLGAAGNLAKQGLLKSTIKEVGKKLEAAGFGTGKVPIRVENIKEAVKGTRLEDEAARFMKAKALKVPSIAPKVKGPKAPTKTDLPISSKVEKAKKVVKSPGGGITEADRVKEGLINKKDFFKKGEKPTPVKETAENKALRRKRLKDKFEKAHPEKMKGNQAKASRHQRELDEVLKEPSDVDKIRAGEFVRAESAEQVMKTKKLAKEKGPIKTIDVKAKLVEKARTTGITKPEMDTLDPATKDLIIAEKLAKAKSPQHRENIKKKYGIKTESVATESIKVPKKLDPMLSEKTLYNAKDKSSIAFNARIDAVLERKRLKAASSGKSVNTYNPVIDTTLGFQQWEEKSGFPIFSKHLTNIHQLSNRMAQIVARDMSNVVRGLHPERFDTKSDARVIDAIIHKKIDSLEGQEKIAAERIVKMLEGYQSKIKYLIARRWILGAQKVPEHNKAVFKRAKAVYDKDGAGALEQWVKTQDFGVIKDGRYLPADALRGVSLSDTGDAFSVVNPHAHPRTAKEQTFVDKPLMLKLKSYVKRVQSDYLMFDAIKDLEKDIGTIRDLPFETLKGVRAWAAEAQGKGVRTGPVGDMLRKTRGQFFKTVFVNFLPKYVRNRLQNVALLRQNYPLTINARKQFQYKRYKITPEEEAYFKTHISQLAELENEHFFLHDSIFKKGMLGKADRAAIAVAKLYTRSDDVNRIEMFKYFLAGLDKDIAAYRSGKDSFNKFLKKTGTSTLTDLEWKKIWSLEPKEARLEMSRMMIEKIHARYKKRERGTAAISEAGEIASTLLQFPKMVIARFTDAAEDVLLGNSHQQRWSGAQIFIGNIVMMAIANEMYQTVWGRRTYYDPVLGREVEYRPYSFGSVVSAINPGSFQLNHIQGLNKIVKISSDLVEGTLSGTLSERAKLNSIRKILREADNLNEAYVPFLKPILDQLETVLDKKTYRLLSTSFDHITNRQSAISRNRIERSWVNKIRHSLGGGNVKEEPKGGNIKDFPGE